MGTGISQSSASGASDYLLGLLRGLYDQLAVTLTVITAAFYVFVRQNYDNFYDRLGVTPEEVGLDFAALALRTAAWLLFFIVLLSMLAVFLALSFSFIVIFPFMSRALDRGVSLYRRERKRTIIAVMGDLYEVADRPNDESNGFLYAVWGIIRLLIAGFWMFAWRMLLPLSGWLFFMVFLIALLEDPIRALIILLGFLGFIAVIGGLLYLPRTSLLPPRIRIQLAKAFVALEKSLDDQGGAARQGADLTEAHPTANTHPQRTTLRQDNARRRLLGSALWGAGLVITSALVLLIAFIVIDKTQVVPKINKIVEGERVEPSFLTFLAVRADPVEVAWTGNQPRPDSLDPAHRFMFLGLAQGVVVLYDIDAGSSGQTMRVPAGSVVLSVVTPLTPNDSSNDS